MKHLLLILLLLTACAEPQPPPGPTLTTATAVSAPSEAPVEPSATVSATIPLPVATAVPEPPKPDWEPLIELTFLLGDDWLHHEKGDIWVKGNKFLLKNGGRKVRFEKGKAGSKTPWNLVFWAPKPGHFGGKTVSGGCGFYEEVHDGAHNAFCKGYGLTEGKGIKFRLQLDRKEELLRVRIGDFFDEVLKRK